MDDGMDLSGAAFWLALGAIFVTAIIARAKKDQAIQESIRASIEKLGHVDPALVKLVEDQQKLDAELWGTKGKAGGAVWLIIRRVIAVFIGVLTVILSVGIGVAVYNRMTGIGISGVSADGVPQLHRTNVWLPWIAALIIALPGGLLTWLFWGRRPKAPADNESLD